jgi:prolyl-tRNA editing enzyme YbaK/EbsC (Cys-tRNA(Pro) deacylase)
LPVRLQWRDGSVSGVWFGTNAYAWPVEWPDSVERVAAALRAAAVDARLEEFASPTDTAAAAAEAVGCSVAEIVKSLVFICGDRVVLALVPGDKRADPAKVAGAAHEDSARIATAEEVTAATGYEPGAGAPLALPGVARVLLERNLLVHERVWIGAGSTRHVAGLAPADLLRITEGRAADLVAP